MAVIATMRFGFRDNKEAQSFSNFLYHEGYTNRTLFQNSISVEASSQGDRVAILGEATKRGATVLEDNVEDTD